MAAAAKGFKRPGGGPSPAVAQEFMRADMAAKPGARTQTQVVDRKAAMNAWAEGKGKAP